MNLNCLKMTEEELPRLQATRAANRGVITKIIEESDAILENDTALLDMKTRNQLTRIDTMLKEKLQLISELDEKILTASKIEDIIKEVEDADFFKMRLMDAIANISTSTTPAIPKASPQHQENSTNASSPPASTSTSTNASIPPASTSRFAPASRYEHFDSFHFDIAFCQRFESPRFISISFVPQFDSFNATAIEIETTQDHIGKGEEVTQFRSFWDSFESTVHTNTDLTKIDKFNYLVSLLKGTASRAIAGLPITEENYNAAVDIINK